MQSSTSNDPAHPNHRCLPLELWSHIIEDLGLQEDNETLKTCTLVSRKFSELSRKHLFKRIVPYQPCDCGCDSSMNERKATLSDPRCSFFSLVKEFCIDGLNFGQVEDFLDDFGEYLDKFTRVEYLHVKWTEDGALKRLASHKAFLKSIDTLSFNIWDFGPGVAELIAACSNVKRLSYVFKHDPADISDEDAYPMFKCPSTLIHLHLININPENGMSFFPDGWRWFMTSTTPLSSLEIGRIATKPAERELLSQYLMKQSNTLDRLQVYLGYDGDISEGVISLQNIACFKALRVFKIQGLLHYDLENGTISCDYPVQSVPDIIKLLPTCLQELELEVVEISKNQFKNNPIVDAEFYKAWDNINDALCQSSLPSLKAVNIQYIQHCWESLDRFSKINERLLPQYRQKGKVKFSKAEEPLWSEC